MILQLKPLPINLLSVESDEHGLSPENLLKALIKWNPEDAKNSASNIPKVLYTVSHCENPTGVSTSHERKKQIYKVRYWPIAIRIVQLHLVASWIKGKLAADSNRQFERHRQRPKIASAVYG